MIEPDSGDLPRDEGKLLYRWKPTTKTTLKVMEPPEEYAVFELSETYGGCIIYGKYNGKWEANASARALVVHLLERANNGSS